MAQYSILNTKYSIRKTSKTIRFSRGLVPRLIVVAFLFARINSTGFVYVYILKYGFLLCETSNGERKIIPKRLKIK